MATNKGFYGYHAVGGSFPGDDYPVWHIGEPRWGIITGLWSLVCLGQSTTFLRSSVGRCSFNERGFSVDRLLPGDRISELFPCLYFAV